MSGILKRLKSIVTKFRARLYGPRTMGDFFRSQGATVGKNTYLLTKSLGSEPYLITLEDEVAVSTEVMFITHDGGTWAIRDEKPNLNKFGRIHVGRRAMIGARAIILPGVTIGERCVIGAGSVVTRDIPPRSVAAGVPAKVICSLDDYIARIEPDSIELPDRASREQIREAVLRVL